MKPLRMLGRALAPEPGPDSTPAPAGRPAIGAPDGWPGASAGPATRSARPRPLRSPTDDPPTDPHGWPAVPDPDPHRAAAPVFDVTPQVSLPYPVPGLEARLSEAAASGAALLGGPPRSATTGGRGAPGQREPGPRTHRSAAPWPGAGPDPDQPPWPPSERAEAAGLATAFAADYLSWDETDADRRGRVLATYLNRPGADPARLGWDGTGRQRAEFAVPGRVTVDRGGRLLVDVRVRVTPYRLVGSPSADPEPELPGAPAVAPAPTGRGWRGLASLWVRLSVPVVRDGARLAIDGADEAAGPNRADPTPPVVDDDPLADPSAEAGTPSGAGAGAASGAGWPSGAGAGAPSGAEWPSSGAGA